jgi:hypothetical protein
MCIRSGPGRELTIEPQPKELDVNTKTKTLLALPVAGALGLISAGPATAQAGTASVVVVHGIPDTPVDVYVDGTLALDNFTFGTVTDPLALPAGSHKLDVRAADAQASAAPLLTATASVTAGQNVSVVAHLTADGKPVITPFVNDMNKVAPGQGRLVVRHTAAAPAVDILAGGQPVFKNLSNPNQAQADLPAGNVSAAVALAGTTAPVIGPADVPVTEGSATIVYAVGSASAKNLKPLVQTIGGLHSAPTAVNTGNSGLAADTTTSTLPLAAGGAVAVLMAGAFLATVNRRAARQA